MTIDAHPPHSISTLPTVSSPISILTVALLVMAYGIERTSTEEFVAIMTIS
jgi:hypothetical protein